MSGLLFWMGSRQVRALPQYRTALLNICLQNGINLRDFYIEEDGTLCFRVSFWSASRLFRLCKAQGIKIGLEAPRGLPHLICLYRKRAGLFIGVVLGLILFLLSGRFVWDVRVSGNERMEAHEVEALLRSCGFGVGSYIPNVKTGELENRVLLSTGELSWISIFLDGTVARVQVIEQTSALPCEPLSRPANLVAGADGQIEVIELYRGNCVVVRGQAVKKGELLVSGLYDSQLTGYRWTRASGKVLARTEHTFRVEIPLSYEEKVYSEAQIGQIDLLFFDFSMKIFKNTGNLPLTCDIIKEEKPINLFGVRNLPFSLTVTRHTPYTVSPATRTPEQALEQAYRELDAQMSKLSSNAELLRKDIRTSMSGDCLVLECTVECIEDIAVQVEFEITGNDP